MAATGMGRSSLYVTDADYTAAETEAHAPTGLRHPVQGVDQQLAADAAAAPAAVDRKPSQKDRRDGVAVMAGSELDRLIIRLDPIGGRRVVAHHLATPRDDPEERARVAPPLLLSGLPPQPVIEVRLTTGETGRLLD